MTSPVAEDVLARLRGRGWSVATAESLTGGLVASALVDVPGASTSMRGGVVAYATAVKAAVLGVDSELLDAVGAVHPDVAVQMAQGVCRVVGADVGLATTGVAGPDPQDGVAVGTVCLAVTTPRGTTVETVHLEGDRASIRRGSVAAVLDLCRRAL